MEDSVWQAVLGEIELTVSRASFATWFKNTAFLKNDSGNVKIGVPNIFAKQQLEIKFKDQIEDTLKKNGVTVTNLEFAIHTPPKEAVRKTSKPALGAAAQTTLTQTAAEVPASGINSRYSFESFIVGSGNELAYAACQAIVENPGTKYNPLFVYGGVGLGKTHLIQAVGNEMLKKKPNAKVLYITSETFVNEFLDSIRFKKKGFADKYRRVDVLIVDDMQFIAGKEKTQEEFFHTFNALHQANKQIIISSDKPPKSIPTLTERLRSRFEWGMTVDIQPPDYETRAAILQTKASSSGVTLADDVVEYLASHIQNNIRELEGALNQLLAFCEMRGLTPNVEIATTIFESTRARPRHLSPKQVVERTARHFHIEMDDIMGPKRDKDIVVPRQVAMYLLRSELHLSFPKVARELGRKDHTTAIHSVEKIEKNIKIDSMIRQHVNDIKEQLYA
ncbi:MAG: chromosomal replication initiator protein DnaA [Candidatus Saccharimonadales bacterium]|nr:chromosomal replication initiator protein DnaA [Candidatus Saccharimonadales bacterium]